MQALQRMALLSKSDSSGSLMSPKKGETIFTFLLEKFYLPELNCFFLFFFGFLDEPLSPEAEQALQSLERKMQGPPGFTQTLKDQTVTQGSCARLSCHLTGMHQLPTQKAGN